MIGSTHTTLVSIRVLMRTVSSSRTANLLASCLALVVVLAACDTGVDGDEQALTVQDATVLANLTAQALGDRTGGFVMGLHDLTAEMQTDTLRHAPSVARPEPAMQRPSAWRGRVEGYTATFDEENAQHHIAFDRTGEEGDIDVTLAVQGRYLFEGDNGERLQFPDPEAVVRRTAETRYDGTVTWQAPGGDVGSIHTFRRDDIVSLLHGSDPMELDARLQQDGTWQFPVTEDEVPYTLTLRALDVTLNRTDRHIGPSTLVARLSGVMELELHATLPSDGEEHTVTAAGRITFEPEGATVLQFDDLPHSVRLDLDAGISPTF